jgi:hypothetical protein
MRQAYLSIEVMLWQKHWHEPNIIQIARYVPIAVLMRNDDSNHPGYDAVRTDILVPTFRSSLLLPPSGWYTLTKLVVATSETLLLIHQNTSPQPRQLEYSSLRSKLFSSALTCNKNSLFASKMPLHDNFPESLYTPLYLVPSGYICYDRQFKILRFKTHGTVPNLDYQVHNFTVWE